MDGKHASSAQTYASQERPIVLKAERLVKIYGKRTVVKGVSFEVREGEVVGLLGANGAGKTTSFRMACGLIQPNGGKVTLNGLDVTNWPMHRRTHEGRLGYLPQDRSTFGALTTEQNLIGAMEFLGYTRAQQREKLDELLVKFNLTHIRRTKVGFGGSGGLSGGERRRLEIARALLSNPKILLLDEPFANVDPITVDEMQKVIEGLVRDNVAILITDHQVAETLAITDRSYIVNKGEVICSGPPLTVLTNPKAINTYFGKNANNLVQQFRSGQLKRVADSQHDENAGALDVSNVPLNASSNADDELRVYEYYPPTESKDRQESPVANEKTQESRRFFLRRREEKSTLSGTTSKATQAQEQAERRVEPQNERTKFIPPVEATPPRPKLGLSRKNYGEVQATPPPPSAQTGPNQFEEKFKEMLQSRNKKN